MIRPIIFFDLETTGTNALEDKIVEIALTKREEIDGKIINKSFRTKINPGIPIPQDTSEFHGIYDEDVKESPPFAQKASHFLKYIKGCDLAGYNIIGFDIPLLCTEFERCGLSWNPFYDDIEILDSMKQYFADNPRNLQACYKSYYGEEFEDAHTAAADVNASIKIFDKQMEECGRDKIIENSKIGMVDAFGKLKRREDGVIVFNFSKNKGKPVKEVDKGFMTWFYRNNFPKSLKDLVKQIRHEDDKK